MKLAIINRIYKNTQVNKTANKKHEAAAGKRVTLCSLPESFSRFIMIWWASFMTLLDYIDTMK